MSLSSVNACTSGAVDSHFGGSSPSDITVLLLFTSCGLTSSASACGLFWGTGSKANDRAFKLAPPDKLWPMMSCTLKGVLLLGKNAGLSSSSKSLSGRALSISCTGLGLVRELMPVSLP
jgi:hypothetical protein